MTANELRIGNYLYNENSEVKEVIKIVFTRVWIGKIDDYWDAVSYDEISAIPLTEEWLEKFSFEFDQDYGLFGFFNKHHAVYKCDDGSFEFHPFCTNDKDCHIKLEYVHQLQNLYFALTGEELTFKS